MSRITRRQFGATTLATLGSAQLGRPAFSQADNRTYKLGVVVGLSGLGSQIGQWILQGAELGVERINREANAQRFTIVTEDSQWNPQRGVEGFNKLVNVDRVDVVLAGGSAVMEAIAPIADSRQMVLLNVGAQAPTMAGIGRFTFSVLQLADFDIRVLAEYAYNQLGRRAAATMYVNNDTGRFNQQQFTRDFQRLGGRTVAAEAFRPNETSYGAQVAKIASANPDCVYVVGTPAELPFAVRQLRGTLPQVQILSYAGLESQEFLNAAGATANGIVYTTTFFDPASTDPAVQAFVAAYRARHNAAPNTPYVGYGYDAVTVLQTALAESRAPGEPLRAAIMRVRRFPGVTGEAVFRDDGTVAKAVAVKEVREGRFNLITVVRPS
jgi:branched-chain amino acid transport system substrate-binding protein